MAHEAFAQTNRMGEGEAVSTTIEPSHLSRKEVASELGISLSGVDYHIRAGNLNPVRSGNRCLIEREEVEILKEKRPIRSSETIRALLDERNRQDDFKFQSIHDRLSFLEDIAGVSGRPSGLTKAALLAITEDVILKNRQVNNLGEEERDTWIRRIAAMDYKTVRYCLKTPEVNNLPIWLLRLGIKLANSSSTKNERNKILLHCRNLRLLLQSFSPPRPIYYCTFPLLEKLSPIDSLIIASHATH